MLILDDDEDDPERGLTCRNVEWGAGVLPLSGYGLRAEMRPPVSHRIHAYKPHLGVLWVLGGPLCTQSSAGQDHAAQRVSARINRDLHKTQHRRERSTYFRRERCLPLASPSPGARLCRPLLSP